MHPPTLFGQLWKGTDEFGRRVYWATGTRLSARPIVPSHKSGWNCLACSSLYQPSDLLLRLWDYVKTCTHCGRLRGKEAWGEKERKEGGKTRTGGNGDTENWAEEKMIEHQEYRALYQPGPLTYFFFMKTKNTHFLDMNPLMLPIAALAKLISGESHSSVIAPKNPFTLKCSWLVILNDLWLLSHAHVSFHPLIPLFLSGLCSLSVKMCISDWVRPMV